SPCQVGNICPALNDRAGNPEARRSRRDVAIAQKQAEDFVQPLVLAAGGNLSPEAAVAVDDFIGFPGSPGTGCVVGKVTRRQSFPDIEHGIYDSPASL